MSFSPPLVGSEEECCCIAQSNNEGTGGCRHKVKVALTLIEGEKVHEVEEMLILTYSEPCSVFHIMTCLLKAKTTPDISINIIEIRCLNSTLNIAKSLELGESDVLAMDTDIVSVEAGYVWNVTTTMTISSTFKSPAKDQKLAFDALKKVEEVVIKKSSTIFDHITSWNAIVNHKNDNLYESNDSTILFNRVVTMIKAKLENERASNPEVEKLMSEIHPLVRRKETPTRLLGGLFQNVYNNIFGRPVVKVPATWNPYSMGFYRSQGEKPCCLGPLMSIFSNIPQLINASIKASIENRDSFNTNFVVSISESSLNNDRKIKSFKKQGDIMHGIKVFDELLTAIIYHAHFNNELDQCQVFNTVTHLHTAILVDSKVNNSKTSAFTNKKWNSFEFLEETFSRMLDHSVLLQELFRGQRHLNLTCTYCSCLKELPAEFFDYIDLRQYSNVEGMTSLDER